MVCAAWTTVRAKKMAMLALRNVFPVEISPGLELVLSIVPTMLSATVPERIIRKRWGLLNRLGENKLPGPLPPARMFLNKVLEREEIQKGPRTGQEQGYMPNITMQKSQRQIELRPL
jgi:hypothetical protein